MTDTATVSMWGTLVPVLVGGAIGLVGGWLGPMLVERRKEATEKKKIRAAKFEELVAAVYEHQHWLNRASDIRVFGQTGEIQLSPLSKIHAISSTYFPELDAKIKDVEKTARNYEMWMLEAGKRRLAGDTDNLHKGSMEVYRPYFGALNSLLDELREYAKRELK